MKISLLMFLVTTLSVYADVYAPRLDGRAAE